MNIQCTGEVAREELKTHTWHWLTNITYPFLHSIICNVQLDSHFSQDVGFVATVLSYIPPASIRLWGWRWSCGHSCCCTGCGCRCRIVCGGFDGGGGGGTGSSGVCTGGGWSRRTYSCGCRTWWRWFWRSHHLITCTCRAKTQSKNLPELTHTYKVTRT